MSDQPVITEASTWKKATLQGIELTVPSGNVCRVRRPDGMQIFLEKDLVPNTLMPIVQEALDGKKMDVEKVTQEAMSDPQKLADMINLMDAVVIDCVLEPKVAPIPKDDNGKKIPFGDPRRDENILYVDEVDGADKSFIFNFALGGTRDLDRFRQQQADAVAAVEAVSSVARQAE